MQGTAVEGRSASQIKAEIAKVSRIYSTTKNELNDAMEAVFGSLVGCEEEEEDEEEVKRKTNERGALERKVRALRGRLKSLKQELGAMAAGSRDPKKAQCAIEQTKVSGTVTWWFRQATDLCLLYRRMSSTR
jgi:phage-related minor tail protein